MGQFGNQPDFATSDIQVVTPSDTISSATKLNGAVIYIGDNATVGNELKVIPAGVVGPTTVTALVSLGFTGSGGTDYGDGVDIPADVLGGSGQDMQIQYTAVNGVVTEVTLIDDAGSGYLNGDIVILDQGDVNATFKVVTTVGLPTVDQAITFKGLGTGGFLPVTVDYVLAAGTTVAELIAAK